MGRSRFGAHINRNGPSPLEKYLSPTLLDDVADLKEEARASSTVGTGAISSSFQAVNTFSYDGWYEYGVGANASGVELNRWGQTDSRLRPLILWDNGTITRLVVVLNEARTAGTATVSIYIDGVDSGINAEINEGNSQFVEIFPNLSFTAGQEITFVLDSSSFAPTGADVVNLTVEVSL